MQVAIIGCGKLGGAYAKTLVKSGILRVSDLYLIEKDQTKWQLLDPTFKFFKTTSSEISKSDIILISVKPQDFVDTAKELSPFLSKSQAIISVMAGVKLAKIEETLGHTQIVRSMPNLGVAVGKSITPYVVHPKLEPAQENKIIALFKATGDTLKLEQESQIDAVTAISGNGPGYVFYFIECLVEAAVHAGFTSEQAEKLVATTVDGAIDVWRNGSKTLTELRKAICTPGGTCEAAFKVLAEGHLQKIINQAVQAGLKRSQELGSKS